MVVIGDEHVDALLIRRGVPYTIVPDEVDVQPIADAFEPHVIVYDLLDLDDQRIDVLSRGRLSVSVSPIFNGLSRCDLVFHRTRVLGADWETLSLGNRLRAGLEYAVVREQCQRIDDATYRRNLDQHPLAVAVSMGGADAGNMTLRVLETLRDVPKPMLFWVLLGEGYVHSYEALVECVKRDARHEIILAKTSDSMWRVMSGCGLAILAGGTVTYEAAYAGLPSINLFDNAQHPFLVRELVERGAALSAGHPFEDALCVAAANLLHLESHRDELWAMHEACSGLIDGSAARRIASEILAEADLQRPEMVAAVGGAA
jgi:hypothetical protein